MPGSEHQIVGRRLIARLDEHLRALRALPSHGNRALHYDHVVVAHLVAFFNPAVDTLRDIEDVFESGPARRRFGLPRVPRSTLSDAQRVFDPHLLAPLVEDLKARVNLSAHDPRLDRLTRELIAVDGTFFTVAARVAWALYNKSTSPDAPPRKGNVRVDIHFDVLRGVPEDLAVTDGRLPEHETLAAAIQKNRFYLLDRGFQAYQVLADIVAAGSDFLVRLRQGVQFEILRSRALSAADRLARVSADREVRILSFRAERAWGDTPLRCLQLIAPDGSELQLLTNRLDLPAEIISVLYRHRWQVELFFRWLKCMVNFQHFFSESVEGVTLQVYAAVIGTLLIALETGSRPNKYDYAMMVHVMTGLVPAEDAPAILERRRAERARAAAWQKAYNARKKVSR